PLAGAVGGRCTAVVALSPLDGDVGAYEAAGREPRVEEAQGVVAQHARFDVDAGGTQALGAAALVRARVVGGVDDARDAGLDERHGAGARASRVVTGLEGDDGGRAAGAALGQVVQGVDLGVRGSRPVVPALGEDLALGGEDDGADLRIPGPAALRGELQRATHRGDLDVAGHPDPLWLGRPGIAERARMPAVLPLIRTRKSPCITVGPGIPPDQPLAGRGSRTLTAGSDSHRPRSTFGT